MRSVAIKTLAEAVLNSYIILSLSLYSYPPCMNETVNPFSLIYIANYSTYSFLLQKITHYAISKLANNSIKVSNFHSALLTGQKNCLIPSKVKSSFLTRILAGSLKNC